MLIYISYKFIPHAKQHPRLDKIQSIVSGWKKKLLNQAAKSTLINLVMHSMPIYALSASYISNEALDTLEWHSRIFFWEPEGGKRGVHLINWPTIQLPKFNGGLGIKNLRLIRPALLAKRILSLLNHEPTIGLL